MTPDRLTLDSAQIVAERLQSALRPRSFGFRLPLASSGYCLLYLDSGEGVVSAGDPVSLGAPALLWLPWSGVPQLRLSAGSSGIYALFGEPMLSVAIGHNADARELWRLSRLRGLIDLGDDRALRQECAAAMAVFEREVMSPAPGSESLIECQIRLLLVHMWRRGKPQDTVLDLFEAPSLAVLQRFRQLVEQHFRQRWTVGAYAVALGVSTDRLHDICQRNLGRPPGRLIRERLGHEAMVLLHRSSMTLDQIAAELGFADAPQFSRFFSAQTGMPPARYRRQLRFRKSDATTLGPESYADWP